MSDAFPIVEVQPEWVIDPEEMGSKTKFWYRKPHDETNWLFKHPRPNTGEHWAEKIAAEVASVIGIKHAEVELATFQGERGSVTESFVPVGSVLCHGNQMLEDIVGDYDPGEQFHQSNHTLTNIWAVMDRVFLEPEAQEQAKLAIAEYTVLDALIGNTDRHHENWGVLLQRNKNVWRGFVAPSFDHASSLGRELLDERRDKLVEDNLVSAYAERGRGAIYWSKDEPSGPSPLELARRAARQYPIFLRPALKKLRRLDESSVGDIMNRVPDDWMSPSACKFAVTLMRYNFEQLGRLVR